jgi:hypothetical protein
MSFDSADLPNPRSLAMDSRPTRHSRRNNSPVALIPCCHGTVYTLSRDRLGAIVESSDAILGRLKRIDGVKVEQVRGRWADLNFPPIRLPDVTAVMVPDSSWRAQAAHRGRIW